jgi:Right handed beta helix region
MLQNERTTNRIHTRFGNAALRAMLLLPVALCLCLLTLWPTAASAGSVTLHPGDNVPSIVAGSPGETTFTFSAGTYRLAGPITPKNNDVFMNASGAKVYVTGAVVVTAFVQSGSHWVASLPYHYSNPTCSNGGCTCVMNLPGCDLSENLFLNNTIVQRVPALSQVKAGTWYWDLTAGKIYLGQNPAGSEVQVSVVPYAFLGSASTVTINGLTIQMFAGEGIYARVIGGASSYNWAIENSVLRFNHLAALMLGNGTQVLNNTICDNGKIGIMGGGTNILVQNNEICRNNYAGYTGGQGGAKFDATTGLVVRENNVHDNMGIGFHSDDGSLNTLYEYNNTTRNQGPAIDYEISHSAVIRYNTIVNDAHNPLGTSPYWGAGIWVLSSDNVEVYNNTVTNSSNGIIGYEETRSNDAGSYNLTNFSVHNNTITQSTGIAAGIISGSSPTFYPAVYTTWNNHFDNNTYCLESSTTSFYDWQLKSMAKATWVGTYQQDEHSIWSCPSTSNVNPRVVEQTLAPQSQSQILDLGFALTL